MNGTYNQQDDNEPKIWEFDYICFYFRNKNLYFGFYICGGYKFCLLSLLGLEYTYLHLNIFPYNKLKVIMQKI